jgi:CheY-like chemotaxis protein
MSKKHVLIVDDAKDILFLLQHSVKRLGPEYEVSTAPDGPSALEQVQKQQFDLVLTDYMMPGMTGLELAQEVRRIAPETQVILMTAHDTSGLRDTVEDLHLGGYVGKPFSVPQIQRIVQRVFAQTHEAVNREQETAIDQDQIVFEQLKMLYNQTGAHYVLLLNTEGQPLQVVGRADRAKIARLATFVAANFLAVTELATLVGDTSSVFKSSYYEGSNYNIYAYDINGEHLLAVVFGTGEKPGTVWFYTKQTAAALVPLLGADAPDGDKTEVADEFNDLLGQDGVPLE